MPGATLKKKADVLPQNIYPILLVCNSCESHSKQSTVSVNTTKISYDTD